MELGRYGVFVFTDMLAPDALAQLAKRIESLGYSTLWYPEGMKYESMALAGFLLGNTSKLIVASGIANIYARDASAAGMGHNSLNSCYDERFVLGLGVSHENLVNGLRGHDYGKPLTSMRNYLDAMERSWEAFGNTPTQKQVMLAALGPKMTELAAERTLGALPYNVTPEHAATARKILGPDALLCCEQKICLCDDADTARAAARSALAMYLTAPNYFNNWFRLGFDESDLENGGSDRLMDAMVFWGSEDQIRAKLQGYFDAGANQVVIQTIRSDGVPGPDWDALEAFAPGT